MKPKDQMLWEERMLLNRLAEQKGLYLNIGTVISGICIDYLFSDRQYKKNFAIIKSSDKLEKDTLNIAGYKVLQTETLNINQIDFLAEYIFRS